MPNAIRVFVSGLLILVTIVTSPTRASAAGICGEIFDPQTRKGPEVRKAIQSLKDYMSQTIVGQSEMVDTVIMALISGGHIWLRSPPGLGKTLTAETLAKGVRADYKYIPFKSDKMPSDIVGIMVRDPKTGKFVFRKGPLFGNIVLVDEFNRAPPKTTGAVLEAMSEKRITDDDGVSHPLPDIYLVIAATNPLDGRGTYELPQAAVDRFMFSVEVNYLKPEPEADMFSQNRERERNGPINLENFLQLKQREILEARRQVVHVEVPREIDLYIAHLLAATRPQSATFLPALNDVVSSGIGPRGGLSLGKAAQAHAWLNGRNVVEVSDVRAVAHSVLGHRIELSEMAKHENWSTERVVDLLLEMIPR